MVINDILCVMVWATGILQISCSDFCKQIFRSSDLVDLFEVSTRLCCAKGVFLALTFGNGLAGEFVSVSNFRSSQ